MKRRPNPASNTEIVPVIVPVSQETKDDMRARILGSRAPNTRLAHACDTRCFTAWCAKRGLSPLPADPVTIVAYVSEMARGVAFDDGEPRKYSTIERHLGTISRFHQDAGFESPTRTPLVKAAMAGTARELGKMAAKKKPTLPELLTKMLATMPQSPQGIRDAAILLLGIGGAFRQSEIAGICFHHLTVHEEGIEILLPRSKTDQRGTGRTVRVVAQQDAAVCPVRALRRWTDWLKTTHGIVDGHVFRSLRGRNSLRGIDPQHVCRVVQTCVARLGLDSKAFGGHSLRSGHATDAARRGTPLQVIMQQTGHASADILIRDYIRPAENWTENSSAGMFSEKQK